MPGQSEPARFLGCTNKTRQRLRKFRHCKKKPQSHAVKNEPTTARESNSLALPPCPVSPMELGQTKMTAATKKMKRSGNGDKRHRGRRVNEKEAAAFGGKKMWIRPPNVAALNERKGKEGRSGPRR
ncbi:hypothetical protein MRX96_028144 [Rhipicephalus microplus]